jgi:hypothetical protein
MCGPDGRPAISLGGDSAGVTVYFPREGRAFYCPGGLEMAGARIPVRSLLYLVRTGMPMELEQWQISTGWTQINSVVRWAFVTPSDTMFVTLSPEDLFPSSIEWEDGALLAGGATPGDEYSAWPDFWRLDLDSLAARAEIVSIDEPAEPWPSVWQLAVPVPVDTLPLLPLLVPAWDIPRE